MSGRMDDQPPKQRFFFLFPLFGQALTNQLTIEDH